MSSVDIRVDLPSYTLSFTVKVPHLSTISQVKQEIQRACPGQPRPDGQRLIWRGRVLKDDENIDILWKAEPRIVHLAVHPSAWSSSPPEIPQSQPLVQQQTTPLSPPYVPGQPYVFTTRPTPNLPSNLSAYPPRPQPMPRLELEYVFDKHRKALNCLSSEIPPYIGLSDPHVTRNAAVNLLERNGWLWPALLDEEFPAPSEGGLVYNSVIIQGQSYLQLSPSSEGVQPTPAQEHALRVLSHTFSILSMTLPPTPTVRTQQPQSMPIPPHVNQLLQQLGLPPLRPAGAGNNAAVIQNNRALDIRQIPLRPLLAPFIMLLLRTLLLLYFVAPARKPIFGILILGWMLYEIWQPIRNGLRNGWGRIPQNGQQPANHAPNARQGGPNPGQPNVPQAAGGAAVANAPVRIQPGHGAPMNLDQQAGALFDTLANVNIEDEQRVLNQSATDGPALEPGFGHKVVTFLGLLVTTLHPAIWNRRRVALRRREGTVRTEANIRNAPPPSDGDADATPADTEAARRREELRAQYNRRPRWIQQYMERVVAEDWVDDSD